MFSQAMPMRDGTERRVSGGLVCGTDGDAATAGRHRLLAWHATQPTTRTSVRSKCQNRLLLVLPPAVRAAGRHTHTHARSTTQPNACRRKEKALSHMRRLHDTGSRLPLRPCRRPPRAAIVGPGAASLPAAPGVDVPPLAAQHVDLELERLDLLGLYLDELHERRALLALVRRVLGRDGRLLRVE